jgi:hypothetical protein
MRQLAFAVFFGWIPIVSSADEVSTLPFTPAILLSDILPKNDTVDFEDGSESFHHDLVKRDGNCAAGYDSCAYINNPGYCCPNGQNCAIDPLGRSGCCPSDAVCTGLIGGSAYVTGAYSPPTMTTAVYAPAAITAGSGPTTTATFANANGAISTGFSILQNPYYPFKIIPTTYLSAGGCSAAWTGCQTDFASCTASLGGNKVGNSGVTISAPNLATVQATTTYAPATASSICSSLSSAACSGLKVTACSYFGSGNAAHTHAPVLCGAGIGAAVGVAGGWLLG